MFEQGVKTDFRGLALHSPVASLKSCANYPLTLLAMKKLLAMLSVLGLMTAFGCLETEEEVVVPTEEQPAVEVEVEVGENGEATVTEGEEEVAAEEATTDEEPATTDEEPATEEVTE